MIKIHDAVQEILYKDDEILYPFSQNLINLSAYAKRIQKKVESRCMKEVKVSGIVVSLSRIQKGMNEQHPLLADIVIENITAKSPLSEIAFHKTPKILTKLSSLYEKIPTESEDFLTMTLCTSDVTVICSERLTEKIVKHFGVKPVMRENGLASLGISVPPEYYPMPNITYTLIRRIAQKHIPLAETITAYSEIIFVFHEKYLADILRLFRTR